MNKESLVHLFHMLLVGGLFFYVGITRKNLPKVMYPFLLGLGVFLAGYHLYKAVFKKGGWVSYFHVGIIAPLLVYIGLKREETQRFMFEFLLMLSFASFGYHGYYLLSTS